MELTSKIVEIAQVRRRFGYRRIHDLLRPQFAGVNHKRVYRLYTEANLTVRKRKKVKRPLAERVPLLSMPLVISPLWPVEFSPTNGDFGRSALLGRRELLSGSARSALNVCR